MKKMIRLIPGIILILLFPFKAISQTPFKRLESAQMQKELAILRSVLISLHPGTYRFNTPKAIDQYFFDANVQVQKTPTEDQYYILLAKLTTKIKCGHTFLNPSNQEKIITDLLYSKSFFPFLYQVIDHHFIITHNLSGDNDIKPGDEILSINGISVRRIIDSLLTISQTDGNHGLARKIHNLNMVPSKIDSNNYSLFDIYFPLFFPDNFNAEKYCLVIKPYKKPRVNRTVAALSKRKRQEIYTIRFGAIPVREKNWSFKFINKNTAYFRIGDFETWKWKVDYKKHLDSLFTVLRQSGVKNLIVDIRGNSGGDDEARDEVLSYLIDRPFGCNDPLHRRYRFLAIPDTLISYIKTWDKSFMKAKKTEDYTLTASGYYEIKENPKIPCQPVLPKGKQFKGDKFMITDANNSSTTFTMARLFQDNHTGVIVGGPTGGTKQGINGGQLFFLQLPFSKIEIDIPIIWGAPDSNQPDEGVQPDHLVKTTQQNIHDAADAQVNYLIKMIH